MQAAKANPRQQEKLARQSKYIAQLKEQADKRKIEEVRISEASVSCPLSAPRTALCTSRHDWAPVMLLCVQESRFERRLLKERTQEDALYEDKEKFVTAAYKKKLEEDKKWIEQQKLK